MSARVSCISSGFDDGMVVDVECSFSNGLPGLIIVGLANKSVDEAKERIRSAFAGSKLTLPRKRITLNLAPADIPKDGSAFDLALAASIMLAGSQIKKSYFEQAVVIGELGLDGKVRAVRGIIGKLLIAKRKNLTTCYIPAANLEQAKLIPGLTLLPVASLRELYLHATGTQSLPQISSDDTRPPLPTSTKTQVDFGSVVGQAAAKRALQIAAAGHHNVLLNGPPGTGKSMLAKALLSIVPPLSTHEMLEVTHLHSLASKQYDTLVTEPPIRAPHHSASDVAIIGGGQNPRPGEISLSHCGVLFFDELPEFSRASIEALRQPLEDRVITVARAKDSLTFPARFILVATANPCPCGYLGTDKECTCLPMAVQRYQKKLSGPILDRIDLYAHVQKVDHDKLLSSDSTAESPVIKSRVMRARERQTARFGAAHKVNSDMTNEDIKKLSGITNEAAGLLNRAAEQLNISARAYMRAIKVARTIADLEDSDAIEVAHITEALHFRPKLTADGYL